MTSHVPIVPGMRRKRGPIVDDESSGSSATGATGIDSMRPVVAPRRSTKRRKTFLDAFQSISIEKKESDVGDDEEDADSSQAVADEGSETYSTTSSIEDDDCTGDEALRLLSDREEAERKVMLELVFGPFNNSTGDATPSNVVDIKFQELVRKSLGQVTAGAAKNKRETVDDMSVDTSYSRSMSSISTHTGTGSMHRSNSLPTLLAQDGDPMDTDSFS